MCKKKKNTRSPLQAFENDKQVFNIMRNFNWYQLMHRLAPVIQVVNKNEKKSPFNDSLRRVLHDYQKVLAAASGIPECSYPGHDEDMGGK